MKTIKSVITPTVTTDDPHEFREQLEIIESYSDGVHLDFADGEFAPSKLLPIKSAFRSNKIVTHAHIMYKNPMNFVEDIMKLDADLVILHIESTDVEKALIALNDNGTRCGLALLPETSVNNLQKLKTASLFDHVLIFGGHLGFQGGKADLSQIRKIKEVLKIYPDVEIAWDGGVNSENALELAQAGVQVLNVGGFLRNAEDVKKTYNNLLTLVS